MQQIAQLEQQAIETRKYGNQVELEMLRTEDKGHLLTTIKKS